MGAEIRTTIYKGFVGVDYSQPPSEVDKSRSPDAQNMYLSPSGVLSKRPGWSTVAQLTGIYGQPVAYTTRGLFRGMVGGDEHILVQFNSSIYRFDPDSKGLTLLRSGLPHGTGPSTSINLCGKLWILSGGAYLVWDGEELQNVSDIAYIPTTLIGCYPSGGGEFYEAVNMLTAKRKNTFISDGESKEYKLESAPLSSVDEVIVDGETKILTTDYTVNLARGTVTFVAAPPAPAAGQAATVEITFSPRGSDSARIINGCTIMTSYGVGSRDRIVVSGSTQYPNRDWISGLNDPSYIPDTGYSSIGSEATAIVGYASIGAELAIIKEDNGQDATVYLRSAGLSDEGEAIFPVRQGVSGVGAIARGVVGLINDEPVYLSNEGLMGLTSNIITAERMVANRSYRIDGKLRAEPRLDLAVACSWEGYYLIAVNNHCYVIDGRKKTYWPRGNGDYVYECFYWDNIPASCWLLRRTESGEELWFGTGDGRICKLNTGLPDAECYVDDGAAIDAWWTTPYDDDGDGLRLKMMPRIGSGVTLDTGARRSAEILFRTDRDATAKLIRSGIMDLLDFDDIDFARWSFSGIDAEDDLLFRRKVREYQRLQIRVRNAIPGEGLDIISITKRYAAGSFVKV